jgi:hypothetical protein
MANDNRARGFTRKRLFVDPKVQGALLLRAALYWVLGLLAITLMLLCWRIMTGPARIFYTHFDDMWFHFGPALVASLALLPLVLFDVIKVSNRFVGPLLRMRREMRALARGEEVRPIQFRDDDFWREMADEFNAIARIVEQARRQQDQTDRDEPAVAGGQELL